MESCHGVGTRNGWRRPCPRWVIYRFLRSHERRARGQASESNTTMPRDSVEANSPCKSTAFSRRSDRFLAGLEDYAGATIASHVHPDPDSLGSMVGLAHLIETCAGLPVQITQDGPICRAENRAMVNVLDLDFTPIQKVDWRDDTAVIMVDSQPKTGRHSFNG